ncbi:kinase-like domain-containing protein [Cladochytrium replicatum]|nr:kinase-like domain-containing protein [Cladochytrium replicatum]
MAQPPTGSAPSATQNSSSAPIPVPNTTTAQPINVPSSSTQSMAPAPISSSPPRSIISLRKASLVERTSAAIEAKLSSAGVPLRRGSSSATAQFSQILSQDGDQYPMHPDAYELGPAIGYGSSATVYIAKCLPMNKHVAIKMIDLDMFERNQIDELRREIQIMSLSKHPNLLPVHGSFVSGSKLYIVTPFLSAGSCLDIMKTAHPEGLEEVTVSTILKQALQGLEYLHKNGLIHRDVKAGNLLMDDDGLVQLADFGVSSSLDTGERRGMRKTFVGTPCWMAPEVMEQSGYDFKADIWSFGITALELATGHAPFAKYPPIKVLMLTLQNDPPTLDRDTTKHRYSKGFKEMIDTCLQKDPSKRPTAEKLLQHPFFKQAKKNQYLVQVLLKGLPSITSRPHNRRELNTPVSFRTLSFL